MKINCIIRNNQWQKHEKVYETIKITQKLICPHGHCQNILLNYDNHKYSYDNMNWQANKFLNNLNENDIVLLYDRQYKEALLLKIKSKPKKDKISDIKILRNKGCTIHTHICSGCIYCSRSVELVFSNKYFEDNPKIFTKYINENYSFENMYAIYRDIEVIGKIDTNSNIYHKYKCLRTSIRIL